MSRLRTDLGPGLPLAVCRGGRLSPVRCYDQYRQAASGSIQNDTLMCVKEIDPKILNDIHYLEFS